MLGTRSRSNTREFGLVTGTRVDLLFVLRCRGREVGADRAFNRVRRRTRTGKASNQTLGNTNGKNTETVRGHITCQGHSGTAHNVNMKESYGEERNLRDQGSGKVGILHLASSIQVARVGCSAIHDIITVDVISRSATRSAQSPKAGGQADRRAGGGITSPPRPRKARPRALQRVAVPTPRCHGTRGRALE